MVKDDFRELDSISDMLSRVLNFDRPQQPQQVTDVLKQVELDHLMIFCDGTLMIRQAIRRDFWCKVQKVIPWTYNTTLDFFNNFNRLRPEYFQQEQGCETGLWGKEFGDDDIFFFEGIKLQAADHRQDIGSEMVRAILSTICPKSDLSSCVFVKPDHWGQDAPQDLDEHPETAVETFWRSLCFQTVETAYIPPAVNGRHPSRPAMFSQDWVPTSSQLLGLSNQVKSGMFEPEMPRGNNILHVAAIGIKPKILGFLTCMHPEMMKQRNDLGQTPLEALQSEMEAWRQSRVGVGGTDQFRGFPSPMAACLAIAESGHPGSTNRFVEAMSLVKSEQDYEN